MPSYTDAIFTPLGMQPRPGTDPQAAFLAYAGGAYERALSLLPSLELAQHAASSTNGRYLAVLCSVPSASQDPPYLSTAYGEYEVVVIDTSTWEQVSKIPTRAGGSAFPNCLVINNSGVVAIAAGSDGIRIYDALAAQEVAVIEFAGPGVNDSGANVSHTLAFSPAGDFLLVCRVSWGVAVFDTSTWARASDVLLEPDFVDYVEGQPAPFDAPMYWVKFSPAGDKVYYYDPALGLRGRTWPALAPLTLPMMPSSTVTGMAFSPAGDKLLFCTAASSAVATVHSLDITDPDAEPEVVYESGEVFGSGEYVTLGFSPDFTKLMLTGLADNNLRDDAVAGSQYALRMEVIDRATGLLELAKTWTTRHHPYGCVGSFAIWLPGAMLELMTGIITDADDAPVVREVLVVPRTKTSELQPFWCSSDAAGRYRVPMAIKDVVLSRIVFDTTGNFNDLVDKVQVQ